MDSRELNIPTAREAYPVIISGFTLPFVSLLDNEHCTAEMAAVTISRKEFLPSESGFSEGNDDDDDFLSNVVERGGQRDWGSWQSWELGIAAVAVVRGRLAEITRDVLRQEQASLHVKRSGPWSIVTLSEQDERPARTVASLAVCGPLWRPSPRANLGLRNANLELPSRGALSHTSTRDAIGKSGEFALYSQQTLTDGRRVLNFGGLALDEFIFYRLSGPKPQPTSLPFNGIMLPRNVRLV